MSCDSYLPSLRSSVIQWLLIIQVVFVFCSLSWGSLVDAQTLPEVSIGGVLEIEIQHHRRSYDDPNQTKEEESDIALATVEVGIDAKIHSSIRGHVSLLWEEDETEDIADFLDEGTIIIADPDNCPYSFTAGKMYLPFGVYGSNFITDPMTLELGETNETALMVGYEKGFTETSFGFFNGDMDKAGEDNTIRSYFASINTYYTQASYVLSAGVSYISNLLDADGFEDAIDPEDIDSYAEGLGVFMGAHMGSLYLSAEYVGAITNFNKAIFERSIRPEAYNFEVGMQSPGNLLMGLKYEKTKDMDINEAINFPKERFGLAMSYPILEVVSLNFEYMHEKFKVWEEGKGKNDSLTAQLAIEF